MGRRSAGSLRCRHQTRRTALGADDAHGDRLADAKQVTHRRDNVANLHAVGVADRQRRKTVGLDLEQRQVARLVSADDAPLKLRPSVSSTRTVSAESMTWLFVGRCRPA